MTTQHRPWSFFGGDDWIINIQLTDSNNQPYDLDTLSEIRFLLHNPSGEQVVPLDAIQTKTDAPNGGLSIWIPSAETTNFVGGAWTDFVRIVCNGIVRTLLFGNINVTPDPWRAPIAVAPFSAFTSRSMADVVVVLQDERIKRIPRRRMATTAMATADIGTDTDTGIGKAVRAARSGAA